MVVVLIEDFRIRNQRKGSLNLKSWKMRKFPKPPVRPFAIRSSLVRSTSPGVVEPVVSNDDAKSQGSLPSKMVPSWKRSGANGTAAKPGKLLPKPKISKPKVPYRTSNAASKTTAATKTATGADTEGGVVSFF